MSCLLFPCLLGIIKYPWILHNRLLNLEMETLVQIFLAFSFRLLCEAFGASCCLFLETSWSVKNGLKKKKTDHCAVCCLSDIQSPYTELNFNESV